MNITITGGTGFIGRPLVKRLLANGHSVHVLGRTAPPEGVPFSAWDPAEGEPPQESLAGADAVVYLAGEPVAQRWTREARRRIRDSRVEGTRLLVAAVSRLSQKPSALICASAVGIYGSRGDEVLTESSPPGRGFLADLCQEWESSADLAGFLGLRVVKLRIGVVLGPAGGALQRMLPPFRAGLGGRLGSGRQWMSWIYLDDLAALIRFAIEQPSLRGVVNTTAPNPVTNASFTAALAAVLKRPAVLPVPAFVLNIAFGRMAEILLDSQRVAPQAAQAAGFRFEYADLEPALRRSLA